MNISVSMNAIICRRSHSNVSYQLQSRYIIALTATPKRRDGHHPIITMQLEPVRFSINSKNHAALRPYKHQLIIRDTTFTLPDKKASLSIQDLNGLLAINDERNDKDAWIQNNIRLVLYTRKQHFRFQQIKLNYN